MISKASPSVVLLALRAILSAGFLHGSIVTAAVNADSEHVLHNGGISGPFVQSHQFSNVAQAKKLIDSSLLKVLLSEIKLAKKYDVAKQELPRTPSAFPVQNNGQSGERTITLIRDIPDETIEVKVRRVPAEEMVVEEDESDDSSSDSEDDNEDDCNNGNNDDRSEEKDGSDKSRKNDENSDSDCNDGCSDDDNTDNSSEEDTEDSLEGKKKPPSLPMTVIVHKNDGRRFKFELGASFDEIKVKAYVN